MTVRILPTESHRPQPPAGGAGLPDQVGYRRRTVVHTPFRPVRHAWLDHLDAGEEIFKVAAGPPKRSTWLLGPMKEFIELSVLFRRYTTARRPTEPQALRPPPR